MQPVSILIFFLAPIVFIGATGFIIHQNAYRSLYQRLRDRGIVGSDYEPDWSSKVGSSGCLGYITRLKREIGLGRLEPVEQLLVRRVVISYYASVPVMFAILCGLYWELYSA